MINALRKRAKIIYLPGGARDAEKPSDAGFVYSRIKEPLRKTPSKYRLLIRRKSSRERHRHRGRGEGKHKGKTYLRKPLRL